MQFLYDLWWGHITPDTDFPKDVRRVLNSAFGELAVRAQQADLKRMLLTYACCVYQPPADLSTVHDAMPWCMHQHMLAGRLDALLLCILVEAQYDRSNDVSAQAFLSP